MVALAPHIYTLYLVPEFLGLYVSSPLLLLR